MMQPATTAQAAASLSGCLGSWAVSIFGLVPSRSGINDGVCTLSAALQEAVKLLLSHKCNIKRCAMDDMNALHFASQKGNTEILRLLITAGVADNAMCILFESAMLSTTISTTWHAAKALPSCLGQGHTANHTLAAG